MFNRRDELDRFKREINLAEFAATSGYIVDRRASGRSSLVMSHQNGDKIVIACDHDSHWIYFSVRDEADNGTIVDFVQRRLGGSLGEVRKALRNWNDGTRLLPSNRIPSPMPVTRDVLQVQAEIYAMSIVDRHHTYLEKTRFIPAEVLSDQRFLGCVRTDKRGNAIFPHANRFGYCGFEIKNQGFTGFSPGGEKGLWLSCALDGDTALIIAESAIDALSHFAIKRPTQTRYASIAGAMNPGQPELLRLEAAKLPAGSRIVIATDNDEGGDRLSAIIKEALIGLSSTHEISEDRPVARGTDWNDVLLSARTGR